MRKIILSLTALIFLCWQAGYAGENFYISPNGDDRNPGTIELPWKTFERAFDAAEPAHFSGGNTLYLREGIHRFPYTNYNQLLNTNLFSGTQAEPTIIRSYPGERAKVYLSERADTGWIKYEKRPGAGIYYLNWRSLASALQLPQLDERDLNPQGVFLETETAPPFILQQVNARKNAFRRTVDEMSIPESLRTNQDDMVPGDYYYENDLLYVWLPDSSNPNGKKIEVALKHGAIFNGEWIIVQDITFRYSGELGSGTGLGLNGSHNLIENVDSSYNTFTGLDGVCSDCTVRNSLFNYNGNTGANLRGQRTVYEGNTFSYNNYRRYKVAWHCGGIKLMSGDASYMVIRKNIFRDDTAGSGIGLWFDWAREGNLVEKNTFLNNTLGVVFEATLGTESDPNLIRNNIFINCFDPGRKEAKFDGGGVIIKSSHHTRVYNNLFVNGVAGVSMFIERNGVPAEDEMRRSLQYNQAFNNMFIDTTAPVYIFTKAIYDKLDGGKYKDTYADTEIDENSSDYNLFYGGGPDLFLSYDMDKQLPDPQMYGKGHDGNSLYFAYGFGGGTPNLSEWQERTGNDLNSIIADPRVGDLAAFNWKIMPLSADSPAIDAGLAVADLPDDFLGVSRPQPQGGRVDIGAYEYIQPQLPPQPLKGDLSGNGAITIYDASLIARLSIGALSPDLFDKNTADVNQDKAVTVYDASLAAAQSN